MANCKMTFRYSGQMTVNIGDPTYREAWQQRIADIIQQRLCRLMDKDSPVPSVEVVGEERKEELSI